MRLWFKALLPAPSYGGGGGCLLQGRNNGRNKLSRTGEKSKLTLTKLRPRHHLLARHVQERRERIKSGIRRHQLYPSPSRCTLLCVNSIVPLSAVAAAAASILPQAIKDGNQDAQAVVQGQCSHLAPATIAAESSGWHPAKASIRGRSRPPGRLAARCPPLTAAGQAATGHCSRNGFHVRLHRSSPVGEATARLAAPRRWPSHIPPLVARLEPSRSG